MENYYVAVFNKEEWTLVNHYPLTYEESVLLKNRFNSNLKVKILKEVDSDNEYAFKTVYKPNNNMAKELQLN